jgi:prepilin-type N-terminal cleavage/methylation domain-containing protein/prepilin-type processing-associated H-X9-DG protein
MKLQQKAFTLVELLVVISIIALLLAILMPTLRRARDSAKKVVCQSNLRQIGIAMKTYAISNDGKFVQHDHSREDLQWPELLLSYIGDRNAYICSALKGLGLQVKWPNTNDPDYGYNNGFDYISYTATTRMFPGFVFEPHGKKVTRDWQERSDRITIHDGGFMSYNKRPMPYYQYELGPVAAFPGYVPRIYQQVGDVTYYCHSEKINVLFNDTHVDSFNQKEFLPVWIQGY